MERMSGAVRPRDVQALSEWLDELLVEEGERFLREVPWASHLTSEAQPLDSAYYVRHRMETVWRIWLTSRTDALALAHMVNEDYDAARKWGRYTCEELDHDRMYLADLAQHGVSESEVKARGPLPATREMLNYLEREIARIGALPAVAYSVLVEWNSEKFSAPVVDRAAAAFSEDHVAGSRTHLGIDVAESHYPMMVEIAFRLLQGRNSLATLERLIRDIAAHLRSYFVQLYEETQRAPARSTG
jgi:hypothetical protein